jgi:hypothetical protein
MPITLHKNLTYRGMRKRITGYTAQLANVEAIGATPEEAKANVEPLIAQACTFAFARIVTLRGHVSFVGADRGRWYYTAPRDFSQEKDNSGMLACTIDGADSAEAAMIDARYHLAQNVWNGTAEDGETLAAFIADSKSAATFLDWVAWQLRYSAHRAAGMTDVQAHSAACDRIPVPA